MKVPIHVIVMMGGSFLLLSHAGTLAAQNAPVSFRTAIDLALKNSAAMAIGRADLEKARAGYAQTRGLFLPQITFGSGLAKPYGFPLSLEGSAPSVFNVNTQEFLFNRAQQQFVRAARNDFETTQAQNADRRNDVMLETALDYMQLDLLQSSLTTQKEQQDLAA